MAKFKVAFKKVIDAPAQAVVSGKPLRNLADPLTFA
jgi:hypothetical protein